MSSSSAVSAVSTPPRPTSSTTSQPNAADLTVELESDYEETTQSPQINSPAQKTRTANLLSKLIASDSEPDEDAPIKAPRRKLVASLAPPIMDQSDEDEEDGEDEDLTAAYMRIKQQVLAEKKPEESSAGKASEQKASVEEKMNDVNASMDDEEDEEDEFPVRTRKYRKSSPKVTHPTSPLPTSPKPSSRQSSPGLFVSPRKSPSVGRTHESDADSVFDPLEERVKRIRAQRKAEQERQRRIQEQQSDSDSDKDGENGRRLTQQSRPTRKATKKAMEEISRDNQRIYRNMHLAHQAKTKKKYGINDLFVKFNYNQKNTTPVIVPVSSAPVSSDMEDAQAQQDTPPTSPPSQDGDMEKQNNDAPGQSPEADTAATTGLVQATTTSGKGKGRATEFQHLPMNPLVAQSMRDTSRPAVVQNATMGESEQPEVKMIDLDSDSEDAAEVPSKKKLSVFDRIPQSKRNEPRSLLNLRHLAHLTSPGKQAAKGRVSMNLAELQFNLLQKSRQQAKQAYENHIEELRRQGVKIQTEEQREQDELTIEEMVEKAREATLRLAKKEKEQAKKDGTADALLSSDESGDEDYVGSGEEDVEDAEPGNAPDEVELELSGSEDDDSIMETDNEEGSATETNGLLDEEAGEDSTEEQVDETDEEEARVPRSRPARKPRNIVVDDEDEDEDADGGDAKLLVSSKPVQPSQVDDMAAFGFDANAPTLGLTQMFAGTMANMDDTQPEKAVDIVDEQNSLDFLRALPDTQPAGFLDSTPGFLVPNSQASPRKDETEDTAASQFSLGISQLVQTSPVAFSQSQLSELPDPTQDVSFTLPRSPVKDDAPASTVETVLLAESPVMKRKGRLQRRKDLAAQLSDEEESAPNVFDVMKKAAKARPVDNFNKKTSWAKDVVEEQAEESEDEYAGLGGASDDDSADDDGELAEMIDESDVKVDERKMAAFYADKAKAEDEERINKLYKDLTTGAFRRKRGGDDFGLSDSEDELERKRRKKQMEYQRMTKALLSSDAGINKLAQNPKQAAFLRALADQDDEADYDGFLDAPVEEQPMEDSTPSTEEIEEIAVPDSQTAEPAPQPLKRKATEPLGKENRPPPHLRRTPMNPLSKKPQTLAEVQHSISDLIDDPTSIVPESQYSEIDSDGEDVPATRPVPRKPVIDRLQLSRNASMESANSGNLAFHAPSAGYQPGFRLPSLIRRTTSMSTSTSSSGARTPVEVSTVRRGGSTKSNIHAQAREKERRDAMEKVEQRRKASLKKKIGKAREQRSILGRLDSGFE